MTGAVRLEALIDAAEHRFALDGIDEASLRAVMRDAKADPGAVHYHFGGREALAVAVLDRVLAPLNAHRLRLLEQAASRYGAKGVPLSQLVDALIRPDVEAAQELHGRGAGRAKLIGAIYVNPATFVKAEVERHFAPVAQACMPHLVASLPGVPHEIVSWRVRWFVFGAIGALMSDDEAPFAMQPGELIHQLVTSASAAIGTPVSEEEPTCK